MDDYADCWAEKCENFCPDWEKYCDSDNGEVGVIETDDEMDQVLEGLGYDYWEDGGGWDDFDDSDADGDENNGDDGDDCDVPGVTFVNRPLARQLHISNP